MSPRSLLLSLALSLIAVAVVGCGGADPQSPEPASQQGDPATAKLPPAARREGSSGKVPIIESTPLIAPSPEDRVRPIETKGDGAKARPVPSDNLG